MKKLSEVYKDEPLSPSEKVLFWTEYVLRHNGTEQLRSAAVDMPIYQFLLLDILVFVVICFMLFVFMIYFLAKLIREVFLGYRKKYTSLATKNKANKNK